MKNLLWIVVAAVIAGDGDMLYSGSSPKELMNSAAEAVNAPEALEAASDAVGDAVEVIEGAVAGAVDAASDATAAEAAAAKVAEEITVAAAETAEATVDTATYTAAAATDAAADTATDAVAAATTEAASGGMADLLSVDGFNLDKVSEMIDCSEIGAFQKTALKTALEKKPRITLRFCKQFWTISKKPLTFNLTYIKWLKPRPSRARFFIVRSIVVHAKGLCPRAKRCSPRVYFAR